MERYWCDLCEQEHFSNHEPTEHFHRVEDGKGAYGRHDDAECLLCEQAYNRAHP